MERPKPRRHRARANGLKHCHLAATRGLLSVCPHTSARFRKNPAGEPPAEPPTQFQSVDVLATGAQQGLTLTGVVKEPDEAELRT